MGRYFSRAVVALPLVLATGSIIAEEDVFKDAPGFYVELTGPEGETKSQVTTVKPKIVSSRKAGTYGPLKSSDTLWSISNRVRPNKSVSVYQTMTAIFNKNPHAFVNNDINRLVAGAVLAIPTESEIRGVNSQSAQSDFVAKSTQNKTTAPATKPAATPAPSVEAAKPAEVAKPAAKPVVVTPEPEAVAQATPAPVENVDQGTEAETVAAIPEAAEKEINELKTQLDDSNSQLMQVTESNQRLKTKIESLTQDISGLKTKLEEDAKVQAEIKAMLAQQMAEKEAQQAAEAEKEASLLHTIGSSWLYLLGVILFPVLLVVLIFTFWLRARTKQELDEQEKEMAESTSTLMEEENSEFDDLLTSDVADQDATASEDDLSTDGLNNADLESADDLDLLQEIDLDGETSDELDLESPTNDLFEDQPSNDVEEVTDFSFDPEPAAEADDANSLELDIEDELVAEQATIEPEIDFSGDFEPELSEPVAETATEVALESEVTPEPEVEASPDADLAADWEKELSESADDEISFESDLSLDNEVDLEQELGLEDEVDITGLEGLDLDQPVSVEDALAAMDAEAAPESSAQDTNEEELLAFDAADSIEPEASESNDLAFSLEDELQDPSAEIAAESEAEISLELDTDDNELELETLEPAAAESTDETVLDFSNELSLEDELSLEPTEQKADEVSIDAELDLSDELALEPEASIEPELALEPELSLEPELVEPAVEATPEVAEPVAEEVVVEEPIIEEPVAEQAEAATNTPSDNKILSELDLSNIEFEEADESIFDLEADEDTLIQDDEMIVELDEVEDLLAETPAPAQQPVQAAAPVSAEPMEFNSPEPAADELAMDFDFSEAEVKPEPVAAEPEVKVDAPVADTNELEWDFAEVESIDAVKDESAADVEAADMLASQLGEVAFNESAEVPLVDDVEDDFIDINKLLEDSDGGNGDDEPYQAASLDVGLDEFPEILPDSDGIDVDDDEGGIGQKLDLARAYLEIDDKEGAKSILEEIQGLGSVEQISEVEKLLDRLS
ncbi:FimV/HubP family polar landmark protein [Motilimonas pumila]|uniref:Pilus assembly protein FimV n=1 Tax=Motilimonas pumila TaxID=2303987 RepID=A0A418YET9_9GAMM|nr:FimV/HubP family polar landmark protein [Motilimonas pumila]RJG47699.1 hypothetical protein D1Z90_09860 [Motilimonas pumila]